MVHVVWICPGCGILATIEVRHTNAINICERPGCGRGGVSLQMTMDTEQYEEMQERIATDEKFRVETEKKERRDAIRCERIRKAEIWVVLNCTIM